MPSFSYPVIPSDQLLWQQDPEISTMTKAEARTHVNNLFRQALSDKANQPPSASTIASFHLNHPVGRIELCYGMTSPINRIGCWYAKCGGSSDECQKRVKYLHRAVPETTLFFDTGLRRLLFMREELKPRAKNEETIATAHKTSIERSSLYRSAFSDVYPGLASQVYTLDGSPPATPPVASSSSQAGPSRKRARYEDSPQPASSSRTGVATPPPTQQIPVFIVLWTQAHLDPTIFAVLTKDGNTFSLHDHRLELQANGLAAHAMQDGCIQIYREGSWKRLRQSKKIGSLRVGHPILLRVKGVEALATFDWMKQLA